MIFMIASNADSIVAADKGDRRWQVFQVADAKRGDRAYFAQIVGQLEQGGYEAMLHDLLHRDISEGPDPRQVISNVGLFEQYIRAAPPEMRYLHQILTTDSPELEAPGNAQNVTTIQAMHEEMKLTQPGPYYSSLNVFGRTLREVIPGIKKTTQSGRYVTGWSRDGAIIERSTKYIFPPLQACRTPSRGISGFQSHGRTPLQTGSRTAG